MGFFSFDTSNCYFPKIDETKSLSFLIGGDKCIFLSENRYLFHLDGVFVTIGWMIEKVSMVELDITIEMIVTDCVWVCSGRVQSWH